MYLSIELPIFPFHPDKDSVLENCVRFFKNIDSGDFCLFGITLFKVCFGHVLSQCLQNRPFNIGLVQRPQCLNQSHPFVRHRTEAAGELSVINSILHPRPPTTPGILAKCIAK